MRKGIVVAVIVFSLLIPVIATSCDTTQRPEGEAVIGPEGGILEINNEDHPLCGFKIEFPENALNTTTTIQVRAINATDELPPYVESYCSPFEVLPSGLVFNEPVIMTIPFDFGALNNTDFVYVLLFDETNNEWDRCGVISYSYTEPTVTVETIHFSEGAVAKSTVDFGQSVHTWPAFNRETDRFPIPQQGPECKGISVFTAWYFKEVGQGLRNAYCDTDRADDLAERADFGLFPYFTYPWSHDKGAVAKNLWLGLKDDKTPQLLNMKQSGITNIGNIHMVVVYKYEQDHFCILDPMYPGAEYTIEVMDGQLTQYDEYDLFRFESLGTVTGLEMLLTYMSYPPDSDCDGISDDGDLNRTLGDHPCTDGDTEDCDDNCPCTYNPNQVDTDGDGIGDICEINLVLNPGFECKLNFWSSTAGTATYTSVTDILHSGSYAVEGIELNQGSLGRLYQDVTGIVSPGDRYKIGGWIKTESVDGEIVIALDYVDGDGVSPGDGFVKEIGFVSGTQDWTYYESDEFTLPPMPADCVATYFLFDFNAGEGKAWWDDVFLIRTGIELCYDDGTYEFGWASSSSTHGVAVNFTPPTTPWTLSSIKVQGEYAGDDAPFYIEIWDENRNELFAGTYMYSDYFNTGEVWTEITMPEIEVTDDFYVCVFPNSVWAELWIPIHALWLYGDDDLPNSGRSYTGSYDTNTLGSDSSDCDWMIRAIGHP